MGKDDLTANYTKHANQLPYKPSHKYLQRRGDKEKGDKMRENLWRKEERSGRSLCRPRCCSSVAAPLRGCSLLTPRGQSKSLAAPYAAIYEMTCINNRTGKPLRVWDAVERVLTEGWRLWIAFFENRAFAYVRLCSLIRFP